jgi:hypothetical protein
MNARELRIGNYVKKEGRIDKVDSVDLSLAHPSRNYEVTILKPIPITEEWVLKFNFKYQDRDINSREPERFYISNYFGHGEYWIELNLGSEDKKSFTWLNWDIGGGRKHVHLPIGDKLIYVHQLQNLYFALTGEELPIK